MTAPGPPVQSILSVAGSEIRVIKYTQMESFYNQDLQNQRLCCTENVVQINDVTCESRDTKQKTKYLKNFVVVDERCSVR